MDKTAWVYCSLGLFILLCIGTGLYWLWSYDKETEEYQRAKELLAQSRFQAASEIILKHKNYLAREDIPGIDWLPLTVDVLIRNGDVSALAHLYEIYPRVVGKDEGKALAVARGLIANRSLARYRSLSEQWQAGPHSEADWFVLGADALVAQGNKKDAMALLNSRRFSGPEDSLRLIRLAGYYADDDPQRSWKLLEKALVKDPKNQYLRRYRGQILEKMQRFAQARQEYTIAIEKSPDDPGVYQPLAEFYIRNGQIRLALETWQKALRLPENDPVRLQMLFWSRVGVRLKIDWDSLSPSQSVISPLINYLINLPSNVMWDNDSFEKLPDYQGYLKSYQETLWLRVINALQHKQEKLTLNLLNNDLFVNTLWSPELYNALQRILVYRRDGEFKKEEPPLMSSANNFVRMTPFFQELESKSQSKEMRNLLASPYAFPVAFLSAGWFEAGLAFGHPATLPAGLPDWVAPIFAQGIWETKGALSALHFVNLQPVTDSLNLIKGKLMIALGSWDAGLRQLNPLVPQATEIGVRAAYLTALVQLRQDQYNEAKAVLLKNPLVGQSVVGKELLARIANAQRPIRQADHSDSEIGKQSLEGKRPLGKVAGVDDTSESAQQMVESLLIDFPDERTLIEEWELIKKN